MKLIQIDDINDERVSLFSKYNEKQLAHYFEPERGVFIAETFMVIERALERGCEPISFYIEDSYLENDAIISFLDKFEDIDIFHSPIDVINKMTGFNLNRGVLCVMRRLVLPSIGDFLGSFSKLLVLEDVMNPTNIGAIFRSAAALGIEAILLTKACADPFYRRAARVSMGTVFQIPFTYVDESWLYTLKENNFSTIAMALCDDAVSIASTDLKRLEKKAIIMGTEAFGINDNTLKVVDYKVIIPMMNNVDSLNVAAASAVAIWELLKG